MTDVSTIFPMAVITIVFAGALWIGVLWASSGRTWRYVALVPLGLPLSALVNLLVKGPLASGVGELAGIGSGLGLGAPVWFLVFLFLLSPVFEELIKVAPLFIPWARRRASTVPDAFWAGLALGIGFGLGEAAYLAWQIAAAGVYEIYPWYAFTGFLFERTIVVFIHGFMTMLFTRMIACGRPITGFLMAAGAHAVVNSAAMLYQLELIPGTLASLWTVLLLIVALVVFGRIRLQPPKLGAPDADYYSSEEPL